MKTPQEQARVGRARVYLCAPFAQRFEMRGVRLVLEARGLRVRARWIDAETDAESIEAQAGAALECLEDVARADVVVAFSTGPAGWQTGGRHVEFGYALATGKPVFLVGPRENVFHAVPWVRGPFAGVAELLEALS